jgi:uncharacterized membrane protein
VHTLSLVIHVTAAALLVGPQVLLFFAVTPATWLIDDEVLRRQVLRVVTARYGMIAGIALVLLVATGIYQYVSLVPADVTGHLSSYRFGTLFMLKMGLFAIFIGLLVYHVWFIAPRIGRLSEAVVADQREEDVWALDSARRLSFMVSFFMMMAALGVLVLGIMLGSHEFSYVRL